MPRYRNCSDVALTHGFDASWSSKDLATADILEYIVDFEERKLYLPAGYPSLHDYCVEKQRRTRDSARKHIHAAHTAEKFPVVFDLIRQGQLHLSAVIQLAPHLTPENADELLAAAAQKSCDEIRELLRVRFATANSPSLLVDPERFRRIGRRRPMTRIERFDPPRKTWRRALQSARRRLKSLSLLRRLFSIRR